MSTLVQQTHSSHYSQSTMTSGERQLRPSNNPSKSLTQNELQCLYETLGPNRVVKKKKSICLCFFKFFSLDFSNCSCSNFTWK